MIKLIHSYTSIKLNILLQQILLRFLTLLCSGAKPYSGHSNQNG